VYSAVAAGATGAELGSIGGEAVGGVAGAMFDRLHTVREVAIGKAIAAAQLRKTDLEQSLSWEDPPPRTNTTAPDDADDGDDRDEIVASLIDDEIKRVSRGRKVKKSMLVDGPEIDQDNEIMKRRNADEKSLELFKTALAKPKSARLL